MQQTLDQNYAELARSGAIRPDPAQIAVVGKLDTLLTELDETPKGAGLFDRLFGKKAPAPRGLYIWGEVGRGKTLLMDQFFDLAPDGTKRRAHFHAFMVEVHGRLHEVRRRQNGKSGDAILEVADEIAAEGKLLCLDEFQVTDIADAMLLSRLFGRMFERGVVLVTTSNEPPDGLYRNGLNRHLFLPFIDLLKERVDVVKLDAPSDFRLEKLAAAPTWYVPADAKAKKAMDAAFERLAGAAQGGPQTLRVQGRNVVVPNALNGVARYSFEGLCGALLGPADLGAIAQRYHSIVLDGVPVLDTAAPDQVRRFIILIDELYDNRVKLIASAATEPDTLLTSGKQAAAFKRTASRLVEMRSKEWLSLPHGRAVT